MGRKGILEHQELSPLGRRVYFYVALVDIAISLILFFSRSEVRDTQLGAFLLVASITRFLIPCIAYTWLALLSPFPIVCVVTISCVLVSQYGLAADTSTQLFFVVFSWIFTCIPFLLFSFHPESWRLYRSKDTSLLASESYITKGNPENPALVFLPDSVMAKESCLVHLDDLSEQYFCIAVDYPGHGDTADRAFDFRLAAHEVAALIRKLVPSQKATLVGTSRGGFVAMEVALDPELTSCVSALVLNSCSHGWGNFLAKAFLKFFATMESRVMPLNFIFRTLAPLLFRMSLEEQHRQELGNAKCWNFETLPRWVDGLYSRDWKASLKDIQVPVLYLNGKFDFVNVAFESQFVKATPNSRSQRLPGAHLCRFSHHLEYAQSIHRFLSSTFPSSPSSHSQSDTSTPYPAFSTLSISSFPTSAASSYVSIAEHKTPNEVAIDTL